MPWLPDEAQDRSGPGSVRLCRREGSSVDGACTVRDSVSELKQGLDPKSEGTAEGWG